MNSARPFPPFEQIEHTADLALLVRGRDLPELFGNAARGLASLLIDSSSVELRLDRKIELEAIDAEELLVGWLQEILYLLEAKGEILTWFRVEEASPERLVAVCRGEPLDRSRHHLMAEIKAATYHDLNIRESDTPWGKLLQVQIVLDT